MILPTLCQKSVCFELLSSGGDEILHSLTLFSGLTTCFKTLQLNLNVGGSGTVLSKSIFLWLELTSLLEINPETHFNVAHVTLY